MYILHEGFIVEDTDIHDDTLADFDVQVVGWLSQMLKPSTGGTDADQGDLK